MSDAAVKFHRLDDLDDLDAPVGKEQTFSFQCPREGRRCEGLVIKGKTTLKHDPQGKNGGIAQWGWDGNREKPTFTPSVDCKGCWHGYIESGRCVNTAHKDEP